jgi:acetylornithine/succinyldiaminopimelate/putrescine aminotransferase
LIVSATLRQGYEDFARFVNPLVATRAELTGEPYHLVRVDGGRLIDVDGNVAHDFLSGWGTQAFGHRNGTIVDAVADFLRSDQPVFYTSGVSPYAGLVARQLWDKTAQTYDSVFFANGGSEAVEAAMKLARAATGKPRILCLEGAYHGCTLGSCAMMHRGPYRDPFGPHVPEVVALPWEDLDALAAALCASDVAAIVVEPIQIEGGVRTLSGDYVAALCQLTKQHGVLLVADEIQTGLGRTGRFLASENWPRRADIVLLGKALGGGLVPLSAMLTKRDIAQRAYGTHETAESHTSTFSGNGLGCVASLAFLSLLTDDALATARKNGDALHRELNHALLASSLVAEVRGEGLLAGIAFKASNHPWLSFDYLGLGDLRDKPATGLLMCHRLLRAGFITNVCGHDWSVVRLQPPLNTSADMLSKFVNACKEAVEYLCQLQ